MKLQNEAFYLLLNIFYVNIFFNLVIKMIDFFIRQRIEEEEIKVRDSFSHHSIVIDNSCKLIKELNIENINIIFFLIANMLERGYFSVKKYIYSKDIKYDRYLQKSEFGQHIALGYGVCRHESAFLNDIYLKLGYDSKVLNVHLIENLFDFSKSINHSVVIINMRDHALIHDITNESILQLLKYLRTYLVFGRTKIRIPKDKKEEMEIITSKFDEIIYDRKKFNSLAEESYYLILDNRSLFSSFYEETLPHIEMVNKLVRDRKGIINFD